MLEHQPTLSARLRHRRKPRSDQAGQMTYETKTEAIKEAYMLDINLIRENPEGVREKLAKKQFEVDFTDFLDRKSVV